MVLPAGTRVKQGELLEKLESLDIDEGIRIESGGDKIFVNKSPSGTFVMQFGDSEDFRYPDSAEQVAKLVRTTFQKYEAWAY
jgi:hypothetical protein